MCSSYKYNGTTNIKLFTEIEQFANSLKLSTNREAESKQYAK